MEQLNLNPKDQNTQRKRIIFNFVRFLRFLTSQKKIQTSFEGIKIQTKFLLLRESYRYSIRLFFKLKPYTTLRIFSRRKAFIAL